VQIGGLNAAVSIDMSEDFALGSGAASEELEEYKRETLPVLKYFDDNFKLSIVSFCYTCDFCLLPH
jgi:hypothetical protein